MVDVKHKSFGTRNIAEKREFIQVRKGRRIPALKAKFGTRKFQMETYQQID